MTALALGLLAALALGAALGLLFGLERAPAFPAGGASPPGTPLPPPPPPVTGREPTYHVLSETRAGPALFALAERLSRAPGKIPTAKKKRVLMVIFEADVTTKTEARLISSVLLTLAEELEH